MAPENADSSTPAAGGGGRGRLAPFLVVAVLMIAEGVGVFIAARALGSGPAPAAAAQDETLAPLPEPGGDEFAEVALADCKPSNKMSGKLIVFHIRVSALVRSADHAKAQKLAEDKKARIEDSVNTVIRSADLNDFNEPGLETVKRRLKHELGRILGDERLIVEVLIPQLLQSASGL